MEKFVSRNPAIDWLKGVGIVCIVVYHVSVGVIPRGYLGVELFFMISGFFLMESWLYRPTTTVRYTWSRIKRYAIPYILTLVGACLTRFDLLFHFKDLDSFLEGYTRLFQIFTMSQAMGAQAGCEQFFIGSWFIGELILVGGLLYGMLEFNHKLSVYVLFPCLVFVSYNLLYNEFDGNKWTVIWGLPYEFYRALCCMALGALISYCHNTYAEAFSRRAKFINCMGVLALSLYLCILFSRGSYDKYVFILLPWILAATIINESVLKKCLTKLGRGILTILGKYSLYLLLAHGPVLTGVKFLFGRAGVSAQGLCYTATVYTSIIVFTVALYFCSRKVELLLKRYEFK
ncbi:MAG: acyltransferase [Bacteroidales bacterium]|nr:acyltransferase [Bacteroidales bacterium]